MLILKQLYSVFFVIFLFIITRGLTYNVNITNVHNCVLPGRVFPVEILNTTYETKSGYVDTVHGYYIVRTLDDSDRDVVVRLYKCKKRTVNICRDNMEEHLYSFKCDQYLNSLGPWSFFSEAMSGPKCVHPLGIYSFNNAKYNPEYLKNHVVIEPKYTHYRLLIEFKVKAESVSDDVKNEDGIDLRSKLRGCTIIEFDVFFDE